MTIEERNRLLTEIFNLNLVQNYCKKICSDEKNIEDIIGEIWLQVCEVPIEKWDFLLSQGTDKDNLKSVRAFISGICYRNIKSQNSKVWYKIKRHDTMEFTKTDEEWNNINNIFKYNILNEIINGK